MAPWRDGSITAVAWDADPVVAAWPGLPALPGDGRADACVVGLGASGLTAVEDLAGRGLSVIGVDAGRVASGAAGRNGGFLLGGPAPFVHQAISQWGANAAIGLYRATLDEIERGITSLGDDVIRRTGSIRLAGLPGPPRSAEEEAEREREVADIASHENALRGAGIAVQGYDGPLGRGLYLPDDACTNPARRVIEMCRPLVGGRRIHLYEHTTVRRVRPGQVDTDRGTVRARIVIVAVDGWLGSLVPDLAGRVRTARLQMAATTPVAVGRLLCPVYGRWGYDYAQQAFDGRILLGGGRDLHADQEWLDGDDETDHETDDDADADARAIGVGAPPRPVRPTQPVQRYLDTLAGRMAGGPAGITHRWAAPAGFTADGKALCTVIDRSDDGDVVIAVGGYSGTGNLVGPVAARAAVRLALDEAARVPAYLSG